MMDDYISQEAFDLARKLGPGVPDMLLDDEVAEARRRIERLEADVTDDGFVELEVTTPVWRHGGRRFTATVRVELDTVADQGGMAWVNGVPVEVMPRGVCPHGVFVAGGGRDIPCVTCEMDSYEEPVTAADLLRAQRAIERRAQLAINELEDSLVPANIATLAFEDDSYGGNRHAGRIVGAAVDALRVHYGGHDNVPREEHNLDGLFDLFDLGKRYQANERALARMAAVTADVDVDGEYVLYRLAEDAILEVERSGIVEERRLDHHQTHDCMTCGGYGNLGGRYCPDCEGSGVDTFVGQYGISYPDGF